MRFFFLITLLGIMSFSSAQTTREVESNVQVTFGEHLGTTPELRTLAPRAITNPKKVKKVKSNLQKPNNFIGRLKADKIENPDALPQGMDPTRQSYSHRDNGEVIEPIIDIEGLTVGPPNDPTGDVGRDHYVQAVNATTIAVYTKQGDLISTFASNTIWSSVGQSSAGDPIVLYDQDIDRWLITEFPPGNALLVAISETSDPLGAWDAYVFGTPTFPDYPKYGIWPNAYGVTTNEESASTNVSYFINREQLINTETMVQMQRVTYPGTNFSPGFVVPTPVDWTGLTPPVEGDRPIALSLRDDNWGEETDQILVHTFDIDWMQPSNTTVTNTSIFPSPFDTEPCSVPGVGFSCMPQPGNGGGLDGIPHVIMNQPHYRNFGNYEAMVFNFITDVTGGDNLSGIRWVELRREDGGEWTLYQEGTYAPDDGLDRYMGSTIIDGLGNIGLAYIASSEEVFAGLRVTARRASDPLGEMTYDELIVAEGDGVISSGSRFGDYAHMSIDPVDDRTIWHTAEYAGGNSTLTRIFNFNISQDSFDLRAVEFVSPNSGSDLGEAEPAQLLVRNTGSEAISGFSVGLMVNGEEIEVDEVDLTLESGEEYTHSWDSLIDMSALGDYAFVGFVSNSLDLLQSNDTLSTVISHLPEIDAALTNVSLLTTQDCGERGSLRVRVTNLGGSTLVSADLLLITNGVNLQQDPLTFNLSTGESMDIELEYDDLTAGVNVLELQLVNVNGSMDEMPSNNTASIEVTVGEAPTNVILTLTLDDYPEETTWVLFSEDNLDEPVHVGGPYPGQLFQVIVDTLCISDDQCYILELFDSFGDGIVDGGLTMASESGDLLAVIEGDFQEFADVDFCLETECNLTAEVMISNTSGPGIEDGSILIMDQGSLGGTQYSIDNGATFGTEALFTDLAAASYTVVVTDTFGCRYDTVVVIEECNLIVEVEVTNVSVSGAEDGIVDIAVSGGTPPFAYELGDLPSQDTGVFESLAVNIYPLVVTDGLGCEYRDSVVVDIFSSTENPQQASSLAIYPNPVIDELNVELKDNGDYSSFIPWKIYDMKGHTVLSGNLSKYDEAHIAKILMHTLPSGQYLLHVDHPHVAELIKVSKL